MKRKILFVTGSRGEYGYIRPIIKLIQKSKKLDYSVLATNLHLLSNFGNTIDEFAKDKIKVDHVIPMCLDGYTNETMIKSLGIYFQSFCDYLTNNRPDIILLAGDRGEQLISAIVGFHLNIPVAHIQAGELSGNVDGMSRHAITKFAHIHFPSNQDAFNRLMKMGEEVFRIFNVGAPQLDEIYANKHTSKDKLLKKYHLEDKTTGIILQHSITEESDKAYSQMKAVLDACGKFDYQYVIIYPNNDAGSLAIQDSIQKNKNSNMHVLKSIPREDYLGLMHISKFIIGNSSSGILEAPSIPLLAINIGKRQEGRLQGGNVVNVKNYVVDELCKVIQQIDWIELGNYNPYGDGKSSQKIVEILEKIEINDSWLIKRMTY